MPLGHLDNGATVQMQSLVVIEMMSDTFDDYKIEVLPGDDVELVMYDIQRRWGVVPDDLAGSGTQPEPAQSLATCSLCVSIALGCQSRDLNSLPHEGILCVRPLPLVPIPTFKCNSGIPSCPRLR